MVGAYRREIESLKEYHGRQLLELLQNADDEAENTDEPSVLIRLEQNRLIVANNGTPFTKDGISSLMYSNTSPKVKRQKKIGYKGLGFRSILSWSQSIGIKSGPFSIEFSRDNAKDFLKCMLEKDPKLSKEIQNASSQNEKYPIATLAVPKWKEQFDIDASVYDTYVILNFTSDKVRQDIQQQINELRIEVALFLKNLKEIKLESPERTSTISKTSPKDDGFEKILLQDEEENIIDSKKWRIFSSTGEIPEELRQNEITEQYEYDLRIAVNEKIDDDINRLFSFFRTEVKFPFPAIIHGTFDLGGSRNHLNYNGINAFLLEMLAELMIDTAKKLTQLSDDVNWDAMKLLAKKGDFDEKVEKMEFYEKLLKKMKPQELIPVVSKKYMAPDENPVFFETPYAEILKKFPEIFPELAVYTYDDDVQKLIDDLEIGKYGPKDFVKRLNKITNQLNIYKRADLILKIASEYNVYFKPIKKIDMPNLFIDEGGNIIDSATQALIPPQKTRFQLPENVTITFISNHLSQILREKSGTKTGRSITDKLDCFNIQEYRFDSVIRKIVNSTNRFIKKKKVNKEKYIGKMLRSLLSIYNEDTESDNFPANVKVPLITRQGELRNARELYFGKEYVAGKIMEALYSDIDDTVFVAYKEALGFIEENEGKITELLEWIGVEKFPRMKLQETENSEFADYVLKKINYPYKTDHGELIESYENFKSRILYMGSRITICKIPDLNTILDKARFEDIIAWVHADPQINEMIREGRELKGSKYQLKIKGTRNLRTIYYSSISSYIVWKLKTAHWIKTESGQKVKPEICCLSGTLIDMTPLVEIPEINIKDKVFKENNIRSKDIEYILTKIGVSNDFSSFPTETIYKILERLETADPEGKKAKTIYRHIIESKPRDWSRQLAKNKSRKEFIEDGKILAKKDEQISYYPVKDTYYVDNITFCKEIVQKFPIVEIDRRFGKEQVRDIFGVKPLEDIRFEINEEPKRHNLDKGFAKAFESFKPYILAYRLLKPTVITEQKRLKKLKIVLCSDIKATYKHDDTEAELRLNPYEHIQAGTETTAYMLLDPEKTYNNLTELKNDFKFCESFAEIITGILKVGENRKDFRDLFPYDRQQRDMRIKSDLDDPDFEKLKKARELFRNPSDLEQDFWQNILEIKGIDLNLSEQAEGKDIIKILAEKLKLDESITRKVFKNINYEELSTEQNLPHLKALFQNLSISGDDFNQVSYEQIDFQDIFQREITNETHRLWNKFRNYVYGHLEGKNILEKERFKEYVENYTYNDIMDEYDINKELEIDYKKYFDMLFKTDPFEQLNITYEKLRKQKETDLDEAYQKNKETFREKAALKMSFTSENLREFIDAPKNMSLLYFGQYDELLNRFETEYRTEEDQDGIGEEKSKKIINLNDDKIEHDEDDYQSLMDNIDDDLSNYDYEMDKHDPEKPDAKRTKGAKRAGGNNGGARQKNTKEVGFIGEYYVYQNLVKKYSKEKVRWVSEYAKIAEINPEGKDGLGYDLMYIDNNGKAHYVEVKSTNTEDLSFPISPAEVRFGEQQKESYEIILVLNVSSTDREFKNLGNIFKYDEDESFNNNRKFSVENEGFRIRFN
ncbi:MAG: DUF3883 domain-containing protein [Flexistipes sinusarabici]|uniref:DUF3883 domain-containing protein n=1 Tax=Flexistipes sinusarabici TaxID=2352 RepID=A0A5D0MLU2_FLESI|nr:DUF3883 domain-containing protein [Flexistipes sinusarabici]TYB32441.1 MAG: DUF3883 domain-containing protein [Flexistipes sinusarabici]